MEAHEIKRCDHCDNSVWEIVKGYSTMNSLRAIIEDWLYNKRKDLLLCNGEDENTGEFNSVAVAFHVGGKEVAYLFYPLEKAKKEFSTELLITDFFVCITKNGDLEVDDEAIDEVEHGFGMKYSPTLCATLGDADIMLDYLAMYFLAEHTQLSFSWYDTTPLYLEDPEYFEETNEEMKENLDPRNIISVNGFCHYFAGRKNGRGSIPGIGFYMYFNKKNKAQQNAGVS